MGRALRMVGLALGLIGLFLQFCITVPASMEAGRSLFGSILFYFSFFTILTNIGAVLVYVSLLSPSGYAWLPAFASPRMRAGVAVAIAVVFLVYITVLAPLQKLEGASALCNILLHYGAPVIFVLWWLLAGRDGSSRWGDIALWLVYPLAYLAYALVQVPFTGVVLYPFLDMAANGVAGVALSALTITAVFLVISVLAILADRHISRSSKA
jgi:hypothetical protein